MGYEIGARLARDSRAAWTDFAHTVDYLFPKLYDFMTWQGMGREPDAAGGYALYMLRLADLGCGEPCLQEAKAAVQAFPGHGFAFAYETHMTAAAALAAAELAVRTGDDRWLDYAYGPIANLIRLSWVYEVDYGPAGSARTFFGLMPTQEAGVITPKEQYEAWIYLAEFLRLAHGRVDPDVEKLVAEFAERRPEVAPSGADVWSLTDLADDCYNAKVADGRSPATFSCSSTRASFSLSSPSRS